jgi:choloylglycine hydrolase
MRRRRPATVFLVVLAHVLASPSITSACTGITIKPRDGSIIFARTLEFAMEIRSNIIVVPRGKDYVGTAPGDRPGLRWTTKYGFVGANAFDLPVTVDALNENGLYVGLFYFPGCATYQELKPEDVGNALAPWELGAFLLGTCADVREALTAARSVRVGPTVQKDMGFVPGVHFIATDSSGSSVVLEHVGGELRIHQNPLGVLTNSPAFDWHMTNLSNYVNMTVSNVPAIDVGGSVIRGFGQGSGMLGIPGDFTPPSRFVRAVAFSRSALPVATAREGVLQAFHILNQFDIPRGAARGLERGIEVADYTQWTSASDLKNTRYYFRSYENSRIRMIDLKVVDWAATKIRTIPIKGGEQIEDVTSAGR